MAFPLIPFAKLPRKHWTSTSEKKKRVEILNPVSSSSSSSEVLSEASSSSSEYDLVEHLKSLLPSDVVDGEKPTRDANRSHLEDMRVVKRTRDRFKYLKMGVAYLKNWRARERERRKHHILQEYEARIQAYDDQLKATSAAEAKAIEEAKAIDEFRRQKRIERNSRKRIEKSLLAEQFTKDLHLRETDDTRMKFYCEHFPRWRREEMDKEEVTEQEREKERILRLHKEKEKKQAQLRQERMDLDQRLLREDKELSAEVQRLMIQYGTLAFAKQTEFDEDETVDNIFKNNRKHKDKLAQRQQERRERKQQQRRHAPEVMEIRQARKQHKSTAKAATTVSRQSSSRSMQRLTVGDANARGSEKQQQQGKEEEEEGSDDLGGVSGAEEEDYDWANEKEELMETESRIGALSRTSSLTRISFGSRKDSDSSDEEKDSLFSADARPLMLQLADGIDPTRLQRLLQSLRMHQHRRGPPPQYFAPFANVESLQTQRTAKIIRGLALGEVGALALSVELGNGLCPVLEQLSLKDCHIRDNGAMRILRAVKAANLHSLVDLNLHGNLLSAAVVTVLHEVSQSHVLHGLRNLDLSQNELGDSGAHAITQLFFAKTLISLETLSLQRNSISDVGFKELINVMLAVHGEYAPQLHRLGLESNLVSHFAKQELSPLPFFVSV